MLTNGGSLRDVRDGIGWPNSIAERHIVGLLVILLKGNEKDWVETTRKNHVIRAEVRLRGARPREKWI